MNEILKDERLKSTELQLEVDNSDRITLKTYYGKYDLKQIKKLNLAKHKILPLYFDGTYKSIEKLVYMQKHILNNTDFRVYEYIRLTGGIEKLVSTEWIKYDKYKLKTVYLGDILIILLYDDNFIAGDIKILEQSSVLYKYIAKQIKNGICGELSINNINSIETRNSLEITKSEMPLELNIKGGYTEPKVETLTDLELDIQGYCIKVSIYSNFIWTPTKLIDGKQQEPVKGILNTIKIK